jgi:hypothetical protein
LLRLDFHRARYASCFFKMRWALRKMA